MYMFVCSVPSFITQSHYLLFRPSASVLLNSHFLIVVSKSTCCVVEKECRKIGSWML